MEPFLQLEAAQAQQLYHELKTLSFVEPLDPLGHALNYLTSTTILTQRVATDLGMLRQESQRLCHYLQTKFGNQNEVKAAYHALWMAAKANWYRFENAMRAYRRVGNNRYN